MLRSNFILNGTTELVEYWLGSGSAVTFDVGGRSIHFRLNTSCGNMLRSDFMLNGTTELTWYWLGNRSTGTFDGGGWSIQFRLDANCGGINGILRQILFRDVIKEVFLRGIHRLCNR